MAEQMVRSEVTGQQTDGNSSDGATATGDEEIDQALAELDGLHDTPVTTHFERLTRAHETLHHALDRSGADERSLALDPPTPTP